MNYSKIVLTIFSILYLVFDIGVLNKFGESVDIVGFFKYYATVWLIFFAVIYVYRLQESPKGKLALGEIGRLVPFSLFVMFIVLNSYLLVMLAYCFLFVTD